MSVINEIIKGLKNKYLSLRLKIASPNGRAELMRDKFYYLGNNVQLFTRYIGNEPYLISLHDNVVCAADVRFVNHDVSAFTIAQYLGMEPLELDKVGSIELFENCFIGTCTLLMPNCSVGRNSIIAAGSIVTKHIPDGEVWGGVPAHFIMTTEDYAQKLKKKSFDYPWMPYTKKSSLSTSELIKMRQDYFFSK